MNYSIWRIGKILSEKYHVPMNKAVYPAFELRIYPDAKISQCETLNLSYPGRINTSSPYVVRDGRKLWITQEGFNVIEAKLRENLSKHINDQDEIVQLSYLKNKNNESIKGYVMGFEKELEMMIAKAKDYDAMAEQVKKTEAELEKMIQNKDELELTIRDLKSQVGQLMDEKKQLTSMQKDMSGTEYQQIMASLGKFKNDLNQLCSDNFEIQKQAKALQTRINALDDRRSNLSAGLAAIYKEAKKLNLGGFDK